MSFNVVNILVANKLKIYQWQEESVIYNSESGDMHLLLSFQAELLILILNGISKAQLIKKISENYQVDKEESEVFLDNLYLEYQKINLID